MRHSTAAARFGGRRRDQAIGVLAGAAALALMIAAPASAAKLGGKTTLAPEASTFEALADAGVSVAPVGNAKAGANGISFPITGGDVNLDKVKGKVDHAGGLEFSGHGTSLTLQDYVIKIGKKDVLRADVAGGGKVRLADLDLSAAKVKASGSKVVISNVDVLLAQKAAAALSATFGLPDLTGADLGDARVKLRP